MPSFYYLWQIETDVVKIEGIGPIGLSTTYGRLKPSLPAFPERGDELSTTYGRLKPDHRLEWTAVSEYLSTTYGRLKHFPPRSSVRTACLSTTYGRLKQYRVAEWDDECEFLSTTYGRLKPCDECQD